jgi:hypothetical protein
MEKEFVPYNLALRMKQLGFDEPCLVYFNNKSNELLFLNERDISFLQGTSNSTFTKSPTFSQAFRWFREEYKLHSTITSISQESWQWHITKPGESLGKLYEEDFYSYEETELACLEMLIDIVEETVKHLK